jgi:hypothetical protein
MLPLIGTRFVQFMAVFPLLGQNWPFVFVRFIGAQVQEIEWGKQHGQKTVVKFEFAKRTRHVHCQTSIDEDVDDWEQEKNGVGGFAPHQFTPNNKVVSRDQAFPGCFSTFLKNEV